MTGPVDLVRELPSQVPGWFIPAWLAAFGLVVGSFLNVVIHRVPRGLSVVRPRSACPACGRHVPWHENVPVLSWLLLRGRCSGCGAPVSARYVLVEALTSGLVLACWLRFGWTPELPVALALTFVLVALVFIDYEHMLLPDALTLPGTVVGLAVSFWPAWPTTPEDALLGVLLAVFLLEGLNLAYKLLRGRDGFGAGDTKMLMLMGAFLGWDVALLAFLGAALIGTVVAVPLLALSRRRPEVDEAEVQEPEADEAAVQGEADATAPSALRELLPATPEELLAPATYLALAASFVLPHATPPTALAGLLVGLVLMAVTDRVGARAGSRRVPTGARASEAWPLGLAIAGLPPRLPGLVAAGVVLLAWLAARPALRRRLPGRPDIEAEGEEAADVPAAPPILQSEIPLGVFLGIGAYLGLLFGDRLVAWYADRLLLP